MKRVPPPLRISQPCSMDWNAMSGDDKRRFCEHCGCHVHNLSALTAAEQKRFAEKNPERECITYVAFDDKTIAARSWGDVVAFFFKPLRWALATILPFGMIGCESKRTLGKPRPHDAYIEKNTPLVGRGIRLTGAVQPLPNNAAPLSKPDKM